MEEKALESPAIDSAKQQFVSCDQCGHTTKTRGGMTLHKKNKHEIPQWDGNDTLDTSKKEISLNDLAAMLKTIKGDLKEVLPTYTQTYRN